MNRNSLTLGAATVANFASVLVGLWAISAYTSGADQVALLNLWAAWGIALGLLGQVGLITGVLDRQPWSSTRNYFCAACVALITVAALVPVRSQLFAQNESWVVFAGAMAGVLFLLGRQRGALSIRQRGVSAVVVTAGENVLRALSLTAVLAADQTSLGGIAIAAPLAVSLVALASLSSGEPEASNAAMSESRSVAVSVLAGVPAVLAYAVVPLLTLFGSVEQLDQVAFAATLLRGPLVIAAFLAPWFLDRVPELDAAWRGRIVVPAVVSVITLAIFGQLVETEGIFPLLVSAGLTAVTAVAAYLLVVLSPMRITTGNALVSGVVAVVAATVTIFALKEQPTHLSFLGVGAASLLIVIIVSSARKPTGLTIAPELSHSDDASNSASVVTKDAA